MANDKLWWDPADAGDGKRHVLVAAAVRDLDEAQYDSRNRDLQHGHAYDSTCTLMGTQMQLEQSSTEPPIENLIRAGVDTLAAHLCRDRPRHAVVTDGADFELQENAQGIERVLEAEVKRLAIHRTRYIQIRDAGVLGSGIVKIYEPDDDAHPAIDRVRKDEIVVDEEEARDYAPRTIYQRRFVDRWMLIHRFPDHEEALRKANADQKWCSYRRMGRHQVALLEAWHLPSGKGAKDGRRVLCIEGADLVDEAWTKPYFPFLIWDWSPRFAGFWGSGIAEQGDPVQARVNRHDRFIAYSQDKIAVTKVYVQKGSGVTARMDNRVGAIIEVPGRPPAFETPQAVSPEIYQDRAAKRQMFFESLGISQLAAQAKLPANFQGGDSKPALREYRDASSERHAPQDQDAEDLLLTYGDRILDIIEDIASRNGGHYKTTYVCADTREEIDWKEVAMARDQFSLVLQAANGLSRTVAGRRQEIEEDYASATITKEEYRKLRGYPDINAERAIEGAVMELADAIISGLVRGRSMAEIGPEPSDDLEFIIRRVTLKRSYLKAHRAKPAMLERFDTWLEQAEYVKGKGKLPMAAPAMAAPGQVLPGALPGPQMVPNAAPAAPMPAPAMPPGMPM